MAMALTTIISARMTMTIRTTVETSIMINTLC
ncbi:Uncharacterised protein [Bordetella pertussis]|nr:Uncharacterised protein [Bordetella pertussis]CPJ00681.1 Uncharacterised protein [Bordetella pertussis]CPN01883.1 Uncharacterised protein [Bordetella pertussis]CPO45874.1 Uncharacterised protein [Bordetella pertussis]CPP15895.1 Uncharacterised protein [Bordetella pertussis]